MRSIKKRNRSRILTAAAVMSLMWSVLAFAEETQQDPPRNQWIDMEKGPGEARWVDENGVISETPGMKPGQVQQKDDFRPVGPGYVQQTEKQEADQNDQERAAGTGQSSQDGADEGAGQSDPDIAAQEAGQNSQDMAAEEANRQTAGNGGGETGQPAQDASLAEAGQQTSGRAIDPGRPMVALTFDDGPYAPVGNQIMDCLAAYGGKATFYVVGNRCASYQAEMQRMAAEGHEIGNHTYEHKYLNKLSPDQIQYQVNKGTEAILTASGVAPATVRLPGGNKNATVLANVQAPIIMWSIDTLDWKTRNTQSTVDKVLGDVRDGDIILMHELYRQTGDAAAQIIPALVERGFQLVTVSELAQYRGGLQGGHVYSAFRP